MQNHCFPRHVASVFFSRCLVVTLSLLSIGFQLRAAQAPTLTYADLVKRLTSLDYLATLPEAGEKCAQWSSYDRRSKFESSTGKYVEWDANGDYEVDTKPLRGDISGLGRFHAKWHRDAFLPKEAERAIDWTMLKVQGRGRFAGVNLHIWNPRGSWWGEGDEKFFVDGETIPSTFGTGSEDYFGYAWCDSGLFQNAFHNQTQNDGNNKGHVSVNRWHIADQVAFHKSFEGAIEKCYANKRPTLYAATAYWYMAPEATDPYAPVPLSERIGYRTPVESFKVKGAIEGEKMRIMKKTAGNPHEQELTGFGTEQWSGDSQLWWIEAKPGDRLDLAFPVAQAGKYKVAAQFTKAKDYGIVQLYLNDLRAGGPIDLYGPQVAPSGVHDLGNYQFDAKEQKLTVEILGANQKAVKSYKFGLDYIKLEPQ